MEKVICLVWRGAHDDRATFNARLLQTLPAALAAAGATQVRINLEDEVAARGAHLRQTRNLAPMQAQHDGVVQFWLPSAHPLFRAGIDAALAAVAGRWTGWVVAESTVIANRAHPAAPGQRTAGWAQMAFLTVPDGMIHADWLARWQGDHTQVAIETQANFEYVQNLVVRALTPDAPPYAAIVEECFPEAALTDPAVFFDAVGDPAKLKANIDRMMESCGWFITPGTIDVIPTGQYTF
ncbi:MAG: hypothetical protein RIQ99_1581 [Pseudomonadota bacterium]